MILLEILRTGTESVLDSLLLVLPFFLPIVLGLFTWKLWCLYITQYFISRMKWVLVEVKLPKEHFKSPQAMEVVLGALHDLSSIDWWDIAWTGKVRIWSSLEMVSIEGRVHFFIRVVSNLKSSLENHIYSQYPQAEVHEVPDYVGDVPFGMEGSDWRLFGSEFVLTKPDAYPIRTYIDYGLNREGMKEEYKTDPITPTIEFMGSLGPGEQLWLQILVMATKRRFFSVKDGKMVEWKDDAKELITKLMKREVSAEKTRLEMLSPGERDVVAAIERSISKLGFDCGIRMIYLGKGDKFKGANIASLFGSFRQYSTLNLNGFRPKRFTGTDWWNDFFGWKLKKMKNRMFKHYCKRRYFYFPYAPVPMVLNTEELATIYHFPGSVAGTPTFGRIESKRGEAPTNLPV